MQALQSLISEVERNLTCSVKSTHLTDGVLLPCGDKISFVAAKELFGDPETGWKTDSCPNCKVSVSNYVVDHTIRNLAKNIEALQKIVIEMFSNLKSKKEPLQILFERKTVELVQEIASDLTCSIESTLLTDAVSLPCAHKISLVAAKKLFGDPETGWKTNSCPICPVSVSSYVVDDTIRNLAKIFEALQKLVIEINNKSEKDSPKIPYPGKPAELVLEMDTVGDSDRYKRYMTFKSHTDDSLLNAFTLIVYRDNSIGIMLESSEESLEKLKEYLQKVSVYFLIEKESKNCILLRKALHFIFDIIIKNNKIDEYYQELINCFLMNQAIKEMKTFLFFNEQAHPISEVKIPLEDQFPLYQPNKEIPQEINYKKSEFRNLKFISLNQCTVINVHNALDVYRLENCYVIRKKTWPKDLCIVIPGYTQEESKFKSSSYLDKMIIVDILRGHIPNIELNSWNEKQIERAFDRLLDIYYKTLG